jgi:hypothetical protein
MDRQEKLNARLTQLNQIIRETEDRLGAHSVKPVLMQQLFALEEERDVIVAQLRALSQNENKPPSS